MNIFLIVGTRPEAIKMVPVYKALRASGGCTPHLVLTGQHREMARGVLDLFSVAPSYDLDVMEPNQSLTSLFVRLSQAMAELMSEARPDAIIVQGDTTSAMVGAVLGMYARCRVGHVEAGLRTGNLAAPFPEEFNRRVIALAAHWHFAPTEAAAANLRNEGFSDSVYVVGNTVIDAALDIAERTTQRTSSLLSSMPFLKDPKRRTVLVTTHRRENFGGPMVDIAMALAELARTWPNVDFVVPVHPNPAVGGALRPVLSGISNVHLIVPLEYDELVFVLRHACLTLTDSGGLQEEAPAFNVPVLVLRNETERMEGVESGCSQLVGTCKSTIVHAASQLLSKPELHARMSQAANPYGEGRSGEAIAKIIMGGMRGS